MYEYSRRAFFKGLGKITAALGMGFSLGAGCAKAEEPEAEKPEEEKEAINGMRRSSSIARFIVDTHCHISTLYQPATEEGWEMVEKGEWTGLVEELERGSDTPGGR